jgi:hypothetical protein
LVTEAVHEKDGRILLQLWHVRRFPHPALQPDGMLPVAPAASKPAGEAFIENEVGGRALVSLGVLFRFSWRVYGWWLRTRASKPRFAGARDARRSRSSLSSRDAPAIRRFSRSQLAATASTIFPFG